jgi:hypothetical protein
MLLLLCSRQQQLQEPFTTLLKAYKGASTASSADGAQGGSASEQWWRLMQTCAARGHAAYIQQLVDTMPAGAVQPPGEPGTDA